MARPDERALRRLPTLEAHREALERCVFCPTLCRSACPVSNAEPRETITPWGKRNDVTSTLFEARSALVSAGVAPGAAIRTIERFAERASVLGENARRLGDLAEVSPRALLARALGRPPDEFARRDRDARCSGAGGLLPVTMPDVSKAMTASRLADHAAQGGGMVVTACASSARSFRKQGARTIDLVTVIARALGVQ